MPYLNFEKNSLSQNVAKCLIRDRGYGGNCGTFKVHYGTRERQRWIKGGHCGTNVGHLRVAVGQAKDQRAKVLCYKKAANLHEWTQIKKLSESR